MREMNLAVGSLVLMGFIFIVLGSAFKVTGFNVLEPVIKSPLGFFITANTCLIVAVIIEVFGEKPEEK